MISKISQFYAVRRIEDENELKEHLVDTKGMLLVNFWAEWSIQCHNMSYVMRSISPLLHDKDAIFYIDWLRQKGWVKKLGIFGVPTLIVYFSGQEIARFSGTLGETALIEHINTLVPHVYE